MTIKVNIITYHRAKNYGAVLQSFALQRVFEELGCNAQVIDYYPEKYAFHKPGFLMKAARYSNKFKSNWIFRLCYCFLMYPSLRTAYYKLDRFVKDNLKLTGKYYSIEELKQNPPLADVYCTGSDQIWNTDFVWNKKIDKPYYLDFCDEGKNCISYASSFGKTELADWEKDETKRMLGKFKCLSVREESGVDILEGLGLKAQAVLDPTLLLTKNQWKEIASERLVSENYLLLFQINPDRELLKHARKIAIAKRLKLVVVAGDLYDFIRFRHMVVLLPKVEEWLSYFYYADSIITDSFHGTAFSINFEKDFLVKTPMYSTRINNILQKVGLENRIIKNLNNITIAEQKVSYEKATPRLMQERKQSIDWLKRALSSCS